MTNAMNFVNNIGLHIVTFSRPKRKMNKIISQTKTQRTKQVAKK